MPNADSQSIFLFRFPMNPVDIFNLKCVPICLCPETNDKFIFLPIFADDIKRRDCMLVYSFVFGKNERTIKSVTLPNGVEPQTFIFSNLSPPCIHHITRSQKIEEHKGLWFYKIGRAH